MCSKRLRRAAYDLCPSQASAHFRTVHCLHDADVQPRESVGRNTSRSHDAKPRADLDVRKPRFGKCRDIRKYVGPGAPGVAEIIESLSAGITLEPGDVIATGTPSGVALGMTPQRWLEVGDVVEAEIEGIGVLRNRVVAG